VNLSGGARPKKEGKEIREISSSFIASLGGRMQALDFIQRVLVWEGL